MVFLTWNFGSWPEIDYHLKQPLPSKRPLIIGKRGYFCPYWPKTAEIPLKLTLGAWNAPNRCELNTKYIVIDRWYMAVFLKKNDWGPAEKELSFSRRLRLTNVSRPNPETLLAYPLNLCEPVCLPLVLLGPRMPIPLTPWEPVGLPVGSLWPFRPTPWPPGIRIKDQLARTLLGQFFLVIDRYKGKSLKGRGSATKFWILFVSPIASHTFESFFPEILSVSGRGSLWRVTLGFDYF